MSKFESVSGVGAWKPPRWCHPEICGCMRVERVEVVVPKSWNLLSRRQQGAMQLVIDALLVAEKAPSLGEVQRYHVAVADASWLE